MITRLIVAWIGNLIDALSTLHLVKIGFVEANPVMRYVLQSPIMFLFVKIGTMTTMLFWLWRKREDKHAKPLATVAAAVYGAISVYYLWFFTKFL